MKKLLRGQSKTEVSKAPAGATLTETEADTYVLQTQEGKWIFSPEHYPAVIKCDGSGRETAIRLRPTRPVLILSTNGGGTIYYESLYTYDAVLRTETFDTVILFGMREPRIKPLQLEIEEKINDLWAKCHAMQQAASSKAGS